MSDDFKRDACGHIEIDSEWGKLIGFTSDRFTAGHLWKEVGRSTVGLSKSVTPVEPEYMRELLQAILLAGCRVEVGDPMPSIMDGISGWRREQRTRYDYRGGIETVWILG